MYYYYNIWLGGVWDSLAKMIEENYATQENSHCTVVLGSYVHNPVKELRNVIKTPIVVYQTEPLVENHWWKTEHLINNIRDADEIWDFDYQNVEVLRSYGIDAKFKPPLYTNHLKRVETVQNPDIDVLFYGTFTSYRSNILFNFIEKSIIPVHHFDLVNKMNIMTLYNFTGDKLHEYLSRSKIILNISPYEGDKRQEQVRIFYNLINGKCVVSEKSPINYYGDMIVEFQGTQQLSDKILQLLENDNWRKYTNQDFKSYSQTIRQKYNI